MNAALLIGCPKCKALVGDYCRLFGEGDAIANHVHNERAMLAVSSLHGEFHKGYDQAVDEIIAHFENLPAQRVPIEPREIVGILRSIWRKP